MRLQPSVAVHRSVDEPDESHSHPHEDGDSTLGHPPDVVYLLANDRCEYHGERAEQKDQGERGVPHASLLRHRESGAPAPINLPLPGESRRGFMKELKLPRYFIEE